MATTPTRLAALKGWVGSVKSAMKSSKGGKPDPGAAAKVTDLAQDGVTAKAAADLKAIQALPNASARKPQLETFIQRYPALHAECAKAEDLLAQAMKEIGVEQAKKAYLLQAQGKADPTYNPNNKYDLKNLTAKAKGAAKGNLTDVTGSGLSKPEVAAIKTFTADDYKYLNPAVANQKDKADKPSDWMDSNRPKNMSDEDWAKKKKHLYEEGALHAGVMMEGLKKMKAQGPTIYRGFRISPTDFASKYKKGGRLDPTETFQSTSTDEAVAYKFSAGNDKTAPTQTTAVVLQAQLFDGRDIAKLSVYKSEKEILTLPGTVYEIEDVTEMPSGKRVNHPAAPVALEYKIVHAIQKFV